MASRVSTAVLGIIETDYNGINRQAAVFLDKLYKETEIYPDPRRTEAFFRAQYERSLAATAAAKGGRGIDYATRNTECAKTYRLMQDEIIPYINSLYAGNRAYLERSGAKIKSDPTPVPPPDQPVILRIVKSTEPNTAKVYLVRGINSKQKRRSRIFYRILMYPDAEVLKGEEIGSTWSSINLIGQNIPVDEYVYISVIAMNSGGSSLPSERRKFFLSQC